MHQEKYNLNWHTHSDHLKDMLHEMMKSDELTDVTLVCDDMRQLKAHKIVLSACSSVFRKIIEHLPDKNSVIYLRGIQHQEMESILEFMYMGVATLLQERMNEFFSVAKSLEIKEIRMDAGFYDEQVNTKDGIEIPQKGGDSKSEVIDDPPNELVMTREDKDTTDDPLLLKTDGKFQCNQCNQQFTRKDSLIVHIQSIHEGVKYACSQCNQQFSAKGNLTTHIQSIHEGVKYRCNQCDQLFSAQRNLTVHI